MKFNSFFGGCLTTAIVLAGSALLFRGCHNTPVIAETESSVEIERDTIPVFIDTPIPKDSLVLRYETIKVPVYDTIPTHIADTLRRDSIAIEIPITQKIYEDSTYQAWVSGHNPKLDSLRIFQPVTTITHTITNTEVRYKTKRWGVGVQAGIGVTPSKIEPYIGIGVTYNIFSW